MKKTLTLYVSKREKWQETPHNGPAQIEQIEFHAVELSSYESCFLVLQGFKYKFIRLLIFLDFFDLTLKVWIWSCCLCYVNRAGEICFPCWFTIVADTLGGVIRKFSGFIKSTNYAAIHFQSHPLIHLWLPAIWTHLLAMHAGFPLCVKINSL